MCAMNMKDKPECCQECDHWIEYRAEFTDVSVFGKKPGNCGLDYEHKWHCDESCDRGKINLVRECRLRCIDLARTTSKNLSEFYPILRKHGKSSSIEELEKAYLEVPLLELHSLIELLCGLSREKAKNPPTEAIRRLQEEFGPDVEIWWL